MSLVRTGEPVSFEESDGMEDGMEGAKVGFTESIAGTGAMLSPKDVLCVSSGDVGGETAKNCEGLFVRACDTLGVIGDSDGCKDDSPIVLLGMLVGMSRAIVGVGAG